MKHCIIIGMLLIGLQVISQTSIKLQPYNAATLTQYMWSFSKNKAARSQKSLVDFDVMDNWRGFGSYLAVSDDGNYFACTINKMVFNPFRFGLFDTDSLVIQSTKNGQRAALHGPEPGFFSADSRQYIFQDGTSLCFLQLNGMHMRKIADVTS